MIVSLVDDLEAWPRAVTEARDEVECQNGSMPVAKSFTGDAPNNIADMRERVATSSKREKELFANGSAELG